MPRSQPRLVTSNPQTRHDLKGLSEQTPSDSHQVTRSETHQPPDRLHEHRPLKIKPQARLSIKILSKTNPTLGYP